MQGRAAEGIAHIDRAIVLDPLHPPWYLFDRGQVLFLLGRYDEAVQSIDAMTRKDAWHFSRVAAFSALAGDARKAAEAVREATDLTAGERLPMCAQIVNDASFAFDDDKIRLTQGLVKAGWPVE